MALDKDKNNLYQTVTRGEWLSEHQIWVDYSRLHWVHIEHNKNIILYNYIPFCSLNLHVCTVNAQQGLQNYLHLVKKLQMFNKVVRV